MHYCAVFAAPEVLDYVSLDSACDMWYVYQFCFVDNSAYLVFTLLSNSRTIEDEQSV